MGKPQTQPRVNCKVASIDRIKHIRCRVDSPSRIHIYFVFTVDFQVRFKVFISIYTT